MCARDVALCLLPLLAACAGYTTPRPETLAAIAPMPLARVVPGRCELELASPGLTGTFDVVVAVAPASFRVQVFPDVGGKVLDVTVGERTVVADLAGRRYEATAPLDRAEPHLALVLAALFGELLAPVRGERVLGERDAGDGGVEVELRPSLGSGRVEALLGPGGAVERYRIGLGWIGFELAADGAFRGSGFRGRLQPVGGAGR